MAPERGGRALGLWKFDAPGPRKHDCRTCTEGSAADNGELSRNAEAGGLMACAVNMSDFIGRAVVYVTGY